VTPSLRIMAIGGMLLVGVVSSCSESSERPDSADMVDSGSWYSRGQRWPHDGKPYEGENFVVYSDGASLEARQRLADLAEEVLVEVVDEMGVDPAKMFRFPVDQDKIDLYANRYNVLEGGGARAYYAGVIIVSFDYEAGGEPTNVGIVRLSLKHELVHVVEALLKGRFVGDVPARDPSRMPVWFSEGTAEALSGGVTGGAPRTLDQIDGLIAAYGEINPIAWRVDLPLSEDVLRAYPEYYYPMAQLAVEYLLDANGLGKSPEDLAAVMFDIGSDASFASAFETHIGISESDYEAQFFAFMDTYLPQSEPPLKAIGLGFVSLLTAGLVVGSLVWTSRHSPASAKAVPESGAPARSRSVRRGFLAEVSMLGFIVAGLVTLLLFQLAFSELPGGTQRAPGYVAIGVYLVASVGVLIWAIHRWGNRSRGAALIPLLVIVLSGITIVLIDRIF